MRLLVVDDKEGFREQLAHIFTYEGYDVATASSGEKAIGIMAGFEPDIVITDIVMANGDGFFVLEHIQEHASHCPVIIITAYGSQESAVKALRLGAYDYVIKPFDLDIILKAVKRAADYRHLQQVVAQNQSKLATQVSQISALYDTSLDLVSHLALPEMLDSLITRVMDLLGAKGVGIYLYDETRQELTVAISRNLWNDHSGHTITLGEGLAGRVVQSGRPMRVDDYPSWESSLPAYKDTSLANVLGVPLVLQGRVVGVLKVADDAQRGGFSDNDEALLMRLAPLAALAIERARMYDQTKSQLAEVKRSHYEISALQDLTAAIQSSLALPEVLNRIADGVVQGLGYRAAIVAVYDSAKDALVIQSAVIDQNIWAEGENLAGMNLIGSYLTMDNEENLAVSSARRAKMAVTHHLVDLFRPVVDKSMAELLQQMAGVKTLATVPLVADGELVGNFFAASHKESLQETDIISLQAFARQAALAIEHARLFEEERRRHRIANTLVEVSRVINSTLELDEILGLVLEGLQSILEYDSSSILLLEQDHLRVKAIRGMLAAESLNTVLPADNDSVSGLVLDARRPIVLANVQDHPGWRDAPYGLHIHGWIGAPLIARDKSLGLICVDSRQEDVYDEQDAQLVMAFAHHAALAIENARLFEQERKHRRLADTLRGISAIIGSTLDPQELQTLILEQVSWVFPYDSCGLFLWQDGRPALAA